MDGSIYYQFRDEAHADAMIATLDDTATAIKVGTLRDENGAAISGYLVHVYDPTDDLPIEDWLPWVVSIAEPPHVIAGREALQAEGAAWGDDVSLAVVPDTVPVRVPLTDEQKAARAARRAANAAVSAQVKIVFAEREKRDRLRALIASSIVGRDDAIALVVEITASRDAKVTERIDAAAIAADVNETPPNRAAARLVRDAAIEAIAELDIELDAARDRRDVMVTTLATARADRDQSLIDIAAMRVVLGDLRAARDA